MEAWKIKVHDLADLKRFDEAIRAYGRAIGKNAKEDYDLKDYRWTNSSRNLLSEI